MTALALHFNAISLSLTLLFTPIHAVSHQFHTNSHCFALSWVISVSYSTSNSVQLKRVWMSVKRCEHNENITQKECKFSIEDYYFCPIGIWTIRSIATSIWWSIIHRTQMIKLFFYLLLTTDVPGNKIIIIIIPNNNSSKNVFFYQTEKAKKRHATKKISSTYEKISCQLVQIFRLNLLILDGMMYFLECHQCDQCFITSV